MFELFTNDLKRQARSSYEKTTQQFPFIYSVLSGLQNGRTFADSNDKPLSFFVMHDFGWSQFFGKYDENVAQESDKCLFQHEAFSSFKVRLFSVNQSWERLFQGKAELSERCQFRLEKGTSLFETSSRAKIVKISKSNVKMLNYEFGLDLFSRNWPSTDAFNSGSTGFFLEEQGQPVSICYSCSVMKDIHEIDIFTKEKFRKSGYGETIAKAYINEMLKKSKTPNWDCFTNNSGSMTLANKLGFIPHYMPYNFYTYNRKYTRNQMNLI